MDRTPFRRYTAVAAAYVIALQAMFSAFAVPAPLAFATAGPAIICQADRDGAPAQPPAHESCLACLAGHCAAAAGNGARIAVPAPWPVAIPIDAPLHYAALISSAPRERPHSPRAPPAG